MRKPKPVRAEAIRYIAESRGVSNRIAAAIFNVADLKTKRRWLANAEAALKRRAAA